MLTLGLDTATSLLSVALVRGAKTLALETSVARRGQSEILTDLIQSCLAQAGAGVKDLQRIVAVTGPGSFTGLRLGLSAARGLALGLGLPVAGITTFAAVQAAAPEASAVVLESWRAELFVQFGAEAPLMLTGPEIASRLAPGASVAGDGAAHVPGVQVLPFVPLAPVVAGLDAAGPLEPFYLRAPDVTQPAA